MIAALINHVWQSTLFALLAGAFTLGFRNNRAQVRYWLWLAASLKFLLPFSLLLTLGSWLEVPHAGRSAPPLPAPTAVLQIAQPLPPTPMLAYSANAALSWIPSTTIIVWAVGFFTLVLIRTHKYQRIRATVREAQPVNFGLSVDVRSSPSLLEPGVFGLWRPILLVPHGILERLTQAQFEAVIAHELWHIRRRDNITASLHMLVEALFWFHPIVWWIGARLIEERERACDEAVLNQGSEPRDYAEGILGVCRSYVESPLELFSGVTGADIKKRVQAILGGRAIFELNRTKKTILVITAIAAVAAPLIIGVTYAPVIRAQSAPLQFEVASLKSSNGCENAPPRGGNLSPSPGTFELRCVTLDQMIRYAYGMFSDGATINFARLPLEGGPSWMNSEHYSLTAKGSGPVRTELLGGPMLQTFLEERFQLKTHRETRQAPVYDMSVTKSGLKVQPLPAGECTPIDLTHPPAPPKPGDPLRNLCGAMLIKPAEKGVVKIEIQGATMAVLAGRLSGFVGRTVIDDTGMQGQFNFPLEFIPDPGMFNQPLPGRGGDTNPQPAADSAPTLMVALQEQLGLKFSAARGPVSYLIVDHAEKPTPN